MQIRDHFTTRNFSLQHSDMEEFVTPRCKARASYLVWRVFWALYHCSWLMGNIVVMSLSDEVSVAKWFIYLSNWMYLLLTSECVLEALVVIMASNRKSGAVQAVILTAVFSFVAGVDSDVGEILQSAVDVESADFSGMRLPWYIQVTWLLYTVSVVGSVMVSIWYWSLIHKGRELTAIRFNTHAVSSIYVIFNMAVTRFPFRLLHFLYPVAFGVIYTCFTALYYSFGGTNQYGDAYIYSLLDWSRAGRTLVICSLSNFVFIPVVHVMMWAMSLCFQKVYENFRLRRVVYNQAEDSVDGEEVDIG